MPKPVEQEVRELLVSVGYDPAMVDALDHESLMELGWVELVEVLRP
jgi:hypothetical protein